MCALPAYVVPILERIAENEGIFKFETDVGAGMSIGDNFVGDLLTVTINGKGISNDGLEIEARLNLLCKVAPTNAQRRAEFIVDLLFERETHFYKHVTPAFLKSRKRSLYQPKINSKRFKSATMLYSIPKMKCT